MKEMENDRIMATCPIVYAALLSNFNELTNMFTTGIDGISELIRCNKNCAWYSKETGRCAVFRLVSGDGKGIRQNKGKHWRH